MFNLNKVLEFWKQCKDVGRRLLLEGDKTSVATNECHTQSTVLKLTYKWIIDNFGLSPEKTGEFMLSSTFSAEASDELKWCLKLYPMGLDQTSKDDLSLYLCLISCNKPEVMATFEFSVLNANLGKLFTKRGTHRFMQGENWGYKHYISRSLISNRLPDDKLTILCEVNVLTERINIPGEPLSVSESVTPNYNVAENISELMESKRFSDVTILVQGRVFKAHKCILGACSPVFATMFEQNKENQKDNKVKITDVDVDAVEEMLKFIYTGKTNNLEKIAYKLFLAADKYGVNILKMLCAKELQKNLSIENVVDVLLLAETHNAEELKSQAMQYILTKGEEVMNSPEWKNLLLLHPHLTIDIFRNITKRSPLEPSPPKRTKLV